MERRDIPVVSLKEDEFGIAKYVGALCSFIKNSDTPVTIALQGEWGSGKSSFMKILENCLCAETLPKEERYESIWLNTWDLFLENDYELAVKKLILNLLAQMEEHFEKRNKEQKTEKRKEVMKDYLKTVSGMVLHAVNIENNYTDRLLDKVFTEGKELSIKKIKANFEEFIAEEVEEKNNGITDKAFLIFVDDLDRLEPKLAVTLLEALKNLFDIKKCIFILAIDYDVVACGIEQKYGSRQVKNRNIEQDFFDKLIQVPYVIPMAKYDISRMVIERLKMLHFFSREYNYTKYETIIVEIVRLATNKNPRAIKRLLNMMQLALAMEPDREERHPSFMIMELLLMAMQLSFSQVYRMISNNSNLDTWKKSFHVENRLHTVTEHIREQYRLDEEWKEIIYLSVSGDEVIRHNYYRIAKLLEIYEDLQNRCQKAGEKVENALDIVNVICRHMEEETEVRYDGQVYDQSSQTQFKQGETLLNSMEFSGVERVLDVGCGSGNITIEMWNRNRDMQVTAFDIAESQIEKAREHYEHLLEREAEGDFGGGIEFLIMDARELAEKEKYDLIFSNATLHWITEANKMYGLLYDALVPEGRLAVHQGGFGTYRGLHEAVRKAAKNIGLGQKLKNWIFPAFYPEKQEMEDILTQLGFTNIKVESVYSEEKENETLIENFANASLIFYRMAGLSEEEYEKLKEEYFRICSTGKIDKFSHRLYIYAERPKG